MPDQVQETPLSQQEIAARFERAERRIQCLETTLKSVTGEIGDISLGSRCTSCKQCLMVIKDGTMYCPHCGDGRSV